MKKFKIKYSKEYTLYVYWKKTNILCICRRIYLLIFKNNKFIYNANGTI